MLILVVVAVAVIAEQHLGIHAIREIVIMFFAVNEAISILENASQMGLPIPAKFKGSTITVKRKKRKENKVEEEIVETMELAEAG